MAIRPKQMAAWLGEYWAIEPKKKKKRPAPASDAPLTVQQAAALFNIPARTLYALCADGSLPHARIGTGRGTIRIKPADLNRLVSNGSSKTGLLD